MHLNEIRDRRPACQMIPAALSEPYTTTCNVFRRSVGNDDTEVNATSRDRLPQTGNGPDEGCTATHSVMFPPDPVESVAVE